jgi:gliding motility-associated-like protein
MYSTVKSTKMKISSIVFVLCFIACSKSVNAQLVANGAYLMGNSVEVGINNNGHEGTFDIAGSHSRTTSMIAATIFGFVANPQLNAWATWDGDFFTPGDPENGFGLEINGVGYSNNASGLLNQIPGALSNYIQDGDCLSVEWNGVINGVGVKIIYRLVANDLFYTTEVTLTNNTAADLTDLYYYRNVDPDNNVTINGGAYDTQNTIVSQPTPAGCQKALVSATQANPWDSYLGFGGIGDQFRVSHGGFTNRDASDIWNGLGGLTNTAGSTVNADEAISLAYKINSLPVGASDTFTFVVVLDATQIDQAFNSLLFFDYVGGFGGAVSQCALVQDTVLTCPGLPVNITLNGPSVAEYTWAWTPVTGLVSGVGVSVDAAPFVTTTYTATGTPISACITSNATMIIVVDVTGGGATAGPDSTGLICNDPLSGILLSDYLSAFAAGGGVWQETTPIASGQFDPLSTGFSGAGLTTGDYTFMYITPLSGMCPEDTAMITITVSEPIVTAGADSTLTICLNSPNQTLSTYLVGADLFGTFEDVSATGQFDPVTTVFDPTGLVAGTYEFDYIVPGCNTDDTSTVTFIIATELVVDAGAAVAICIGESVNLVGSGATAGYTWSGGVTDGTDFYPTTSGMYYVIGTSGTGCTGDDSVFVTVHPLPTPTFVGDIVQGCVPTEVNFTNTTANTIACLWSIEGVTVFDSCLNFSYTFDAPGYYDVTLQSISAEGCVNSATLVDYIYIEADPIASAGVIHGQFTNLQPEEAFFINNTTGATTYVWDFGDGSAISTEVAPSHVFFSDNSVNYLIELIAYSAIGCTDTAWTHVQIDEEVIYYLPNSFTPDGDEFNQSFQPVFTSGVDPYDFTLLIFNRWGEVIFESHDYDQGWDGTYGNKIVQNGMYTWKLEFKITATDERRTDFGHVNILR